MHIAGHRLMSGSFNFTKAAELNNAQNLLSIDDLERRSVPSERLAR
jgi:hypothetical protein